jgi:5-methylcytosine-specific restriction protein B
MSKYQALADFLRQQKDEEIQLGFDQVSDIVGGLPPSAYNERPWWANDSGPTNAHAPGWMSVGWRVRKVDLQDRRVTFIRASSDRWIDRTRQPPRLPAQHAWLVRGANVHGQNLVAEWLRGGYCSVAAPELDEVPPGLSRAEIGERVAEDYGHLSFGARGSITGMLHTFLNLIQVGDVVVTVDDQAVYVGTVTGEPIWVESPGRFSSRRRAVHWANADRPLSRGALSSSAQAKLKGQRTVSDLTSEIDELTRLAGIGEVVDRPRVPAPPAAPLRLPDATDELAAGLLLPKPWLQETIELLAEKRQVVFYGPPGTGKTFVAKRLAEHLAGVDDVRLVQFHPSYSYEDFFEGFRPRVSAEGQLGFELVPGPFRRMVDAARDDPVHPHVLVIDEINRGNLAKVFGELYFLLEYRDEPIELLYSPEDSDFRLPENIFLIGTMNTADRSIALVDAAMRRRFAFQAFFPGRYPIRDLLRAWLRREGLPTRPADLFDELNARIADEDFAIGPSYLMTRRVGSDAGLERIWRTAILPLLEEHYFGQGRDLDKEFGLAALSRAVDAAREEQASPP